jgi:hypothetical protein
VWLQFGDVVGFFLNRNLKLGAIMDKFSTAKSVLRNDVKFFVDDSCSNPLTGEETPAELNMGNKHTLCANISRVRFTFQDQVIPPSHTYNNVQIEENKLLHRVEHQGTGAFLERI